MSTLKNHTLLLLSCIVSLVLVRALLGQLNDLHVLPVSMSTLVILEELGRHEGLETDVTAVLKGRRILARVLQGLFAFGAIVIGHVHHVVVLHDK